MSEMKEYRCRCGKKKLKTSAEWLPAPCDVCEECGTVMAEDRKNCREGVKHLPVVDQVIRDGHEVHRQVYCGRCLNSLDQVDDEQLYEVAVRINDELMQLFEVMEMDCCRDSIKMLEHPRAEDAKFMFKRWIESLYGILRTPDFDRFWAKHSGLARKEKD